MVLAAFVAMVVAGSLLAAWGYNAATSTTEVVAVRNAVAKGETIETGDLRTVSVSVDAAVATIPAEQLERMVVGHRAAVDLPQGALVSQDSIAKGTVPGVGESVVGVTLPAAQLPGEPLEVGDRVRVVDAPGVAGAGGQGSDAGDAAEEAGDPAEVRVTVAGVHPAGDRTTVAVVVSEEQAGPLAARAATGRVVIVLDSRER
ncbi:SAF domain-containing protein [Janibacter hoylei]|uniref:SAF domain-containing protein n=1 Tax=Janibacter hoylei TaxID=364298 RepID=UPI002238DE7B|nr:SAF domain-containing protein [Janibacter hoylei]MCW4600245.1 SAF domain-containing protein [Janibacter hoylei]